MLLCLAVLDFRLKILRNLRLPAISICKQLLLVVQQLLVAEGGVLKVWSLDDGIDRTSLLAKSAVDALCHVDVVSRRLSASILAFLRLDGDSLGRADRLAQLARDAALLAIGVAAQRVFSTEARGQRSLLEGVVYGVLLVKEVLERQRPAARQLREKERLTRAFCWFNRCESGISVRLYIVSMTFE